MDFLFLNGMLLLFSDFLGDGISRMGILFGDLLNFVSWGNFFGMWVVDIDWFCL